MGLEIVVRIKGVRQWVFEFFEEGLGLALKISAEDVNVPDADGNSDEQIRNPACLPLRVGEGQCKHSANASRSRRRYRRTHGYARTGHNPGSIVVEHDLATLDLLLDSIHVLYGEPGGFGVVSQRLSTRGGINQFLKGRLREDNVQIRSNAIEFPSGSDRTTGGRAPILEYLALEKQFDGFTLTVEPGRIRDHDVLGIVAKTG